MDETYTRSGFIRKGVNIIASYLSDRVTHKVRSGLEQTSVPMVRPPGAVDEVTFLLNCTNCDACIKACPHHAIVWAGAQAGITSGSPILKPGEAPCEMCADFPCIAACQEKALLMAESKKIATALIIPAKCLAHQNQMCDYCYEYCPEKNVAIKMENRKPVVFESQCTGCGKCAYYCPAPGKAIHMLPADRYKTKKTL